MQLTVGPLIRAAAQAMLSGAAAAWRHTGSKTLVMSGAFQGCELVSVRVSPSPIG
ncbi:hypothetical protein [Streptomyces chartreusis]|uniref:hypothetical protein n=1 Tax=Streptomyces chartreusis TaxID=1969 RepID=UPI003664BA5F